MPPISLKNEFNRKLLHLLLITAPIIYFYAGKWVSLAIFVSISTPVILLDYFRRKNPQIKIVFERFFGNLLRDHELNGEKLCGASWVGIATCINFLFFKEEIAITAFSIMVICDTAAALVGRSFPSEPFFEKSRNGSLAFFISGTLVLFTCGAIYDSSLWFYIFGFFSLFCATVLEARPSLLNLDDNFVIVIGFALFMTAFDLIWGFI